MAHVQGMGMHYSSIIDILYLIIQTSQVSRFVIIFWLLIIQITQAWSNFEILLK